jgi:pimeloyl-ACP methyl ester carboxylesterase
MANQVDERHQLDINGSYQWIFIRGNVTKPVLLFVHGGPGFPFTPIAREFDKPFLKDFLVVHWDQRGVGKSYKTTDFSKGFTLNQFLNDGLKVTTRLVEKYGSKQVVLIGHSWGTVLSVMMASRAPELFSACLLVGTNTDTISIEKYRYEFMLELLAQSGLEDELRTLKVIGYPPWKGEDFNQWAEVLEKNVPFEWIWGPIPRSRLETAPMKALQAGDYTSQELEDTYLEALPKSLEALHDDYYAFNAIHEVPELQLPVYFIQGALDFNTPSFFAKSYYEELSAPRGKHWVELDGHGHMVLYEAPEALLRILRQATEKK